MIINVTRREATKIDAACYIIDSLFNDGDGTISIPEISNANKFGITKEYTLNGDIEIIIPEKVVIGYLNLINEVLTTDEVKGLITGIKFLIGKKLKKMIEKFIREVTTQDSDQNPE